MMRLLFSAFSTGTVFVIAFLCCVLSFLAGGIPFGYLLGRVLLKDDIRNHGSGNIGATNVGRVIGWKWGGIVLILDAIKGLLPTWAAMTIATHELPSSMHWHVPVAAGMSAIIGHMYPIYLKLRGGKGVATALGVVLILAPKALAAALVVFLVVLGISRVVALASMLAAVSFGAVQLWLMGSDAFAPDKLSLTTFSIGIPLLIVWRHRSNIASMMHSRAAGKADQAGVDLPNENSAAKTDAKIDAQTPDDTAVASQKERLP